MKNIILLFTLLPLFTFAQFKIADNSDNWEEIGNYHAAVYLHKKKDNTKAKIVYRDFTGLSTLTLNSVDYSYYEFEFSTDENTLNDLYKIIEDYMSNKKTGDLKLEFKEGNLTLSFVDGLGGYSGLFVFEKKNQNLDSGDGKKRSTVGLRLKHFKKLFGIK